MVTITITFYNSNLVGFTVNIWLVVSTYPSEKNVHQLGENEFPYCFWKNHPKCSKLLLTGSSMALSTIWTTIYSHFNNDNYGFVNYKLQATIKP